MKFGVVVCPKCKKSKGVILSYKTTKCIKCGKILMLDKIRTFYKTNSESEMRNYLGKLNAELNGKC
jgi:hypothetical protein